MKPQETTIVYLIHFAEPIGSEKHRAQHYIGSTFDLELRMQQHAAGQGAKILEHLADNDIDFDVVRTWNGDRKLERQLKDRLNAALLCPHPECSGEAAYSRGNFDQQPEEPKSRTRRLAMER